MRIGQGYDVHKFGGNGPIMIGGVSIDYKQGLVAHSDGDVLLHALCDALLGSLALGDIGHHFPDNDPTYANADSADLLYQVYQQVLNDGYRIGNADLTIVAQAPKMAPHIHAMRVKIAAVLNTDITNINIKATTTERLGFAGREEGIACYATVLVKPHG